jgi:dihydroorotase/N-acyl-D-amino-acid deacylase
MAAELERAIDAGAFGLSSGLIYAPGIHARTAELAALAAVAARRGGLYASHLRNEARGLFEALDEVLATGRLAGDGARIQVSHLKAGARSIWGRAADAVACLEAARAGGLDVAADQYPYTGAATELAVVLPPALLGAGIDAAAGALADRGGRPGIRAEIEAGRSSWEDIAADPGWAAIRVVWSPTRPEAAGHSIAELARAADADPADVALDLLAADRLATTILVECMSEADVETILGVPWIAICTDAEGRRPGHPILDAGMPHPRTYGTTARLLGHYVRDRGVLSLEAAVAKLTSVPAARLGAPGRGVLREGAFADVAVLDPATVADTATDAAPASHPTGIDHVIVNGVPAILGGRETGARPGRVLRHGG